jgi:hypothetical protein
MAMSKPYILRGLLDLQACKLVGFFRQHVIRNTSRNSAFGGIMDATGESRSQNHDGSAFLGWC